MLVPMPAPGPVRVVDGAPAGEHEEGLGGGARGGREPAAWRGEASLRKRARARLENPSLRTPPCDARRRLREAPPNPPTRSRG